MRRAGSPVIVARMKGSFRVVPGVACDQAQPFEDAGRGVEHVVGVDGGHIHYRSGEVMDAHGFQVSFARLEVVEDSVIIWSSRKRESSRIEEVAEGANDDSTQYEARRLDVWKRFMCTKSSRLSVEGSKLVI